MTPDSDMDSLNTRTMRGAVQEYADLVYEGLNSAERAALAAVIGEVRGKRILDLGVGAGRTVNGLREISTDYVGIDYVPEMAEHCRKQFPGVRFEHADARALLFADGEFQLVFFSCNGISMVDHAGRLAILSEVRRVLGTGGVFIFSTCNRNSPEFESGFRFPVFERTMNPLKVAVRSLRFARDTLIRLRNRLRFRRRESFEQDYAIINDIYHQYGVMLYFVTLEKQLEQLRRSGFSTRIQAYSLNGSPASEHTRDVTLTFVARV
jgi:SAM-dependent methyltransferase